MKYLTPFLALFSFAAAAAFAIDEKPAATEAAPAVETITKTDAEWQKLLTPEQFRVLRKKGTERPFANEYANNHDHGIYRCAACALELFNSETKFESGTGWPSFYQPVAKQNVRIEQDHSFFGTREEVVCARCGGHLGHVFDDGPKPTGLRYCMNSAALKFIPQP